MNKTRMTLTRYYVDASGQQSVDNSKTFTVMINPPDIKLTRGIGYESQPAHGEVAEDPKFRSMRPDKLSFALVLDGTGAVPEQNREVKDALEALNKVVYDFEGDKHEPGRVRLLWGPLLFFGRMESMTVNYKLFKPDGSPLRCQVDLSFVGAMSKREARLKGNRSSPDLTHIIEVKAGDSLPLLCQRIYGDARYYLDVARFNGLASTRQIKPGARLHFPPLE